KFFGLVPRNRASPLNERRALTQTRMPRSRSQSRGPRSLKGLLACETRSREDRRLAPGAPKQVPQKVRGPGVSRGLSTERAVPGSAPTVVGFGGLLHGLAVKRDIEALLLDLGGHAKPDKDVDDLE